jgi:AraC-like DNA-binding protein
MNTLAIREQIPWGTEESVFCEHLQGTEYGTPWHFHPELELILVRKSGGYRIVGDNITSIRAGDLVLVGSNLPHVWYHDREVGPADAIVVQFHNNFAGQELYERPDFHQVRALFERARNGVQIGGSVRDRVAARLESFPGSGSLRRVSELLGILDELSHANGLVELCAAGYVAPLNGQDQERLSRVMQFIHARIRKSISRREVAEVAALSESAFSRFFRIRTGRTFPAYLNEIRLGRAARLLAETPQRVADIASDCGFTNLSNFNRQFLDWKHMTPLTFRRKVHATLNEHP